MAFQRLYPENAGFVAVNNDDGYSRLRDAQNPEAIAYATHMLRLHGIAVPHGADPTALWRAYSAKLAADRAGAASGAEETPDFGVTPGDIPPSLPVEPPHSLPGRGPRIPKGGTFRHTGNYPNPQLVPRPVPAGAPTFSREDLIRAILSARRGMTHGGFAE